MKRTMKRSGGVRFGLAGNLHGNSRPSPRAAGGELLEIAGFDRERLREMAKRARSLGRPEATRHVAQICMELAK